MSFLEHCHLKLCTVKKRNKDQKNNINSEVKCVVMHMDLVLLKLNISIVGKFSI